MNTDHSQLILAYLDGTISEEELARLNAVLLASAEARAQLRSLAAAEMRLRELAAESGRAVAHAEAWFNQAAPGAGEEFAGGVTLFAFARDPRAYRSETWNVWYEGHLGLSGQQQERTDRDPATWERVSTRLPLPSGTRFLVVHIRVNRTKPEPTATPVTFAGAYVDDVKAELLLRPAANVAAENAAQ